MVLIYHFSLFFFFFFNDPATTEIYTLSLHDALPISGRRGSIPNSGPVWSTPTRQFCRLGLRRRGQRPGSLPPRASSALKLFVFSGRRPKIEHGKMGSKITPKPQKSA